MRYALILVCTTAMAQSIVNPNRVRSLITRLESDRTADPVLHCDVSPIKPALNFSFRYQAGYMVTVPMSQYNGPGHGWATLLRVTPVGGVHQPVYFMSQIALPTVPKTKAESGFGGGYLLGQGAYDVRWMMVDDAGRVCRKSWHVDVHPSHADRNVKVAMPPDTVWEIGLRGSRNLPKGADDAPAVRMTIFLHTAPLFARRTRLRSNDMMTLISTVSSLLERVPVRSVRLVMFNLDQQRELYRKDEFGLRDMGQVYQAMANIELGLVDFQVLQHKKGHVDLLTDMVNREIADPQPSDVVLFLGPTARFSDRVPPESLEKTAGHSTQFLYFQLAPFVRQQEPMLGDVIKSAVSRLGGKTYLIHTPGEFAKAIDRLEKGGHSTP